jgi:hypothetical protein
MALTAIQTIRLLTQDNDIAFPFVTDPEIEYFLNVNDNNISRTTLAVCKVILLQLSLRSNTETVDVFTVTGKSAGEYRASLELFLKSPHLNPVFQGVTGYAGGISHADIAANTANTDTNFITTPLDGTDAVQNSFSI